MKKEEKLKMEPASLSESADGTLRGGFTDPKDTDQNPLEFRKWWNNRCHVTNNCNGGNCVRGCGAQ